jgi:hypothetical protein
MIGRVAAVLLVQIAFGVHALITRDVTPALFCAGTQFTRVARLWCSHRLGLLFAACRATVEQLDKMLGRKRGEGDVVAAIDSVCDQSRFRSYDFIPPKMVLGCERVLEFDEHLERLFISKPRIERAQIEDMLCNSAITNACVGVDASNPQNKDPAVFIDGEAAALRKITQTKKGPAPKKPKSEL